MTTSARHLLPIALTLGCLYAHAQSASDAAIQRAISANQVAGVHQHDGALLGVAKWGADKLMGDDDAKPEA